MSQRTTFHAETPLQALLVEQALLLAKQLEATADAAPDGQVLARVEALAVPAAPAPARQAVPPAPGRGPARPAGPPAKPRRGPPKKGGAGPPLPRLRQARLGQGARRPQRPDRRRRRPPGPALPPLPALRPRPLPPGRPPGPGGLRQPPGQEAPDPRPRQL